MRRFELFLGVPHPPKALLILSFLSQLTHVPGRASGFLLFHCLLSVSCLKRGLSERPTNDLASPPFGESKLNYFSKLNCQLPINCQFPTPLDHCTWKTLGFSGKKHFSRCPDESDESGCLQWAWWSAFIPVPCMHPAYPNWTAGSPTAVVSTPQSTKPKLSPWMKFNRLWVGWRKREKRAEEMGRERQREEIKRKQDRKESQRDTEWSKPWELAFLTVERKGGQDGGCWRPQPCTFELVCPSLPPCPLENIQRLPFTKVLYKPLIVQLFSPLKNLSAFGRGHHSILPTGLTSTQWFNLIMANGRHSFYLCHFAFFGNFSCSSSAHSTLIAQSDSGGGHVTRAHTEAKFEWLVQVHPAQGPREEVTYTQGDYPFFSPSRPSPSRNLLYSYHHGFHSLVTRGETAFLWMISLGVHVH